MVGFSVKRGYRIVGQSRVYPSATIALHKAEAKYPGIVWGKWHQGANGRVRVTGKIAGRETSDPVIVERL